MRGTIAAATLGAGALFVGALALFASFLGGVSWRAFERAPEKLGRIPAIIEPDAPTVLTMTASDIDSVPEALEARPRARTAPPAAQARTDLGDVEPAAPRAKAAVRKAPVRRTTLLRRVGLGGGRPGLQLSAPASFDGGGSGAFAGGGAEEGGGSEEERPGSAAPASAAPARQRTLRALTPARGSTAPLPAAAPAAEEAPLADDEGE
ncbi:hypothetical protein EPO15_11330 [bacterium]|nr:MAG: hypothetical protein EPO15_11330 [bacterium]